MAIIRRTMEDIRRMKPRINRAKIDATTEADIRRHMREDERLDAIIDRAVKRLIYTKGMKQMLGQAGAERVDIQPRAIAARRTSGERHN